MKRLSLLIRLCIAPIKLIAFLIVLFPVLILHLALEHEKADKLIGYTLGFGEE